MKGYKEFEGKTLDDAIREACSYYDTGREKLEIEICNDAKGGIFGLVGVKKARIRAKMVELSNVLDGLEAPLGNGKGQKRRAGPQAGGPAAEGGKARHGRAASSGDARQAKQEDAGEPLREKREDASSGEHAESHKKHTAPERGESHKKQAVSEYEGGVGVASVAEMFARGSGKESAKPARESADVPAKGPRGRERARKNTHERENAQPKQAETVAENGAADFDADTEDLARVPFDQLDPVALESAAREIVTRLTEPFLGEATIAVTIGNDRVRVSITGVEDSGLLIGRDGQNLASLQYLVTRMLSNRMKALLRVQIDAGDYRERQDERLRELAATLAEKVKTGGRPQVTRPLSSYHRRIIHLALQDDPLVQTHSKGEGEMKRVMVAKKKQ